MEPNAANAPKSMYFLPSKLVWKSLMITWIVSSPTTKTVLPALFATTKQPLQVALDVVLAKNPRIGIVTALTTLTLPVK